jgi:hypothetical protein
MEDITPACIRSAMGPAYEDNFLFLPADGTRGGIVLAAKSSFLHIANPIKTNHTIWSEENLLGLMGRTPLQCLG